LRRSMNSGSERGFVIPAFLFDPRVWAALALAGAAFGAWWYVQGLRSTIKELEQWQAQVLFDSKVAEQRAADMQAANDAHTREVANGYASAIRSITTDYDSRIKRLLHAGRDSCTASGVPGTATGPDARPSDLGPGAAEPAPTGVQDPLVEACLKLEQDCATTTTNLLYLQHWLKGVK
jgi:hypothetical protein